MKLIMEQWRNYLTNLQEDGTIRSGIKNGHYSRDRRSKIPYAGFADSTDHASKTKGSFLTEGNNDIIVAFFGPSGSGKSYAMKYFVEQGWREIKTNSTRPPRGPEDKEYNFLSENEFVELEKMGQLVNTNIYQGHRYGTHVDDLSLPGPSVMLTDATSLDKLKKTVGTRLALVYTAPPSAGELEQRHAERGTPERAAVAADEVERDKGLLHGREDVTTVSNQEEIEELEKNLVT